MCNNSEYAKKSEEIGLIASSTGQPGGKRTGQKMAHYPSPIFLKEFNIFPFAKINYLPLPVKEKTADSSKDNKMNYQCPGCGLILWGRPNALAVCFKCFKLLNLNERKSRKQTLKNNIEKEQEDAIEILALLKKNKERLCKKKATIKLTMPEIAIGGLD